MQNQEYVEKTVHGYLARHGYELKGEIIKSEKKNLTDKMIKEVNSSTVKSYTYHNKTLTVIFNDGGVYQYLNVPSSIARGFKETCSKGEYLNNFNYVKLA